MYVNPCFSILIQRNYPQLKNTFRKKYLLVEKPICAIYKKLESTEVICEIRMIGVLVNYLFQVFSARS